MICHSCPAHAYLKYKGLLFQNKWTLNGKYEATFKDIPGNFLFRTIVEPATFVAESST